MFEKRAADSHVQHQSALAVDECEDRFGKIQPLKLAPIVRHHARASMRHRKSKASILLRPQAGL
jgi:hypothetical protein